MTNDDRIALWDAHCRYEFETYDVEATMATMTPQPYVNHIPTMAGGVGYDEVKRFYKYHFIGKNPPDIKNTLVSRTVGADSVVDEFILSFTYASTIDWMLPNIRQPAEEWKCRLSRS
jgi:carboxymethylenebutenolidase